jgi:hypothetical protein
VLVTSYWWLIHCAAVSRRQQAFNLFSLAHKTGTIPKPQASAAVSALRSKAELMEQSLQEGVNLKLYRDVASKMAQVSGLI